MIWCMMEALLQVFCPFKGCSTDCAMVESARFLKRVWRSLKRSTFSLSLLKGDGGQTETQIDTSWKRNHSIAYTVLSYICTNNWASFQQYCCFQPYVKLWHPVAWGSLSGSRVEGERVLHHVSFQAPSALWRPSEQDTQLLISSSASLTINSLVPLQLPLLFLPGCMLLKGCHMFIRPEILRISTLGEWTLRERFLWIQMSSSSCIL